MEKSQVKNKNYDIIVISIALIFQAVNNFAKSFSDVIGISEQTFSLMVYVCYITLYVMAFINLEKKYLKNFISISIGYILLILISYSMFPDTRGIVIENFLNMRQILIFYLPAMAILINFNNWRQFFYEFPNFGYLSLLLTVISLGLGTRVSYMELGIQLLPGAMILFTSSILMKNWQTILSFAISTGLIIVLGNRMSLVSLIIYFLLSTFIIFMDINSIKSWLVFFVSLFFLIIIIVFWKEVLQLVIYVLNAFNIDSRNLEYIVKGQANNLGFREIMYEQSINILEQLDFKPNGLFSDRVYLRKIWPDVVYVHNIVLEMTFAFGGIVTFFLLFCLLYKIIKGILTSKLVSQKQMIIVLVCLALPRLMISGSFIIEGYFFLLLGGIMNTSSKKIRN